jgi:hypothetical protein
MPNRDTLRPETVDERVTPVPRESQDRDAGELLEEVEIGGGEVFLLAQPDNHNGALMSPRRGNELANVGELADDLHVGLAGDDVANDLAEDALHSDEQDADSLQAATDFRTRSVLRRRLSSVRTSAKMGRTI